MENLAGLAVRLQKVERMDVQVRRMLPKLKRDSHEQYQILKTMARQEYRTIPNQMMVLIELFKEAIILKSPRVLRLLRQGASPPLRLVWDRDKGEK